MADTYLRLSIEVGQIWEGRSVRRDGSRERVKVIELDGRAALVESENPRPPLKARRRIGLLAAAPRGARDIGNMRLAVLTDGRRVIYPPGGGVRIETCAK